MQKNRIFFIGVLALLAIVIAGSASAFDLNFLGGGDAPEEVTIEGVKFNIPAGFEEDENNSFVNETATSGGLSYTVNGKTYENDDGEVIVILIADYGEYKVTDKILSQVADEKKTVNDHNGYVSVDDEFTVFSYAENDDLVTVTVTDDSLLEQIVV